jgi:hypothetical protein
MRIATMLSTGILSIGLALGAASAQPRGAFGPGDGAMMGPGMMMMGRGGDMCGPRAAGLAEWRLDRIERAVKPTDAQKAKLTDLREASKRAAEAMSKACPASWPATASERLALMETRMQVMLDAVKTVRPAFDGFYGSLDASQKSRLDGAGPRGWGWNWWRNRS